MTVKDIIMLACDFVGEREIVAKLETENGSLSNLEQEKVDAMVRCFNLVNQEIASDYLPYLQTEEVECSNILPFSTLSKTVVNIFEIKGHFGLNMKFRVLGNFAQFVGKAKSVTYSYLPQELAFSDIVEANHGLSARVFAYGVASEFLLVMGLSEDAEIWENRFKDSLFVLSRKRGEHVLPKRRWN